MNLSPREKTKTQTERLLCSCTHVACIMAFGPALPLDGGGVWVVPCAHVVATRGHLSGTACASLYLVGGGGGVGPGGPYAHLFEV